MGTGIKARLENLRRDAILFRGSVVALLSDGSAHLLQSGRVNGFREGVGSGENVVFGGAA